MQFRTMFRLLAFQYKKIEMGREAGAGNIFRNYGIYRPANQTKNPAAPLTEQQGLIELKERGAARIRTGKSRICNPLP